MPSKKYKLQVHLDPDVEEFVLRDYMGFSRTDLVNRLLRAFANRYRNDPMVPVIYENAVNDMIEEEE